MASYSLSSLQAVTASGPGALSGFECRCSCGLAIRSSLATMAQTDAAAHAAWHERQARKGR